VRKGLVATVLAVVFAASSTAAFADCYVNPKGHLDVAYRVGGRCNKWGASARCDQSGWVDFRFKGDTMIGCGVHISPNGTTKWDATTTVWHGQSPDGKKIRCTQHWSNNNTLDVTGERL
jgi:hypothetical protein